MTFGEAFTAMKNGVRVCLPEWKLPSHYEYWWFNGRHIRDSDDNPVDNVRAADLLRTDWQVFRKLYTFAEAYAEMKKGKFMKPINQKSVFWMQDNCIFAGSQGKSDNHGYDTAVFSRAMVDAQWEEVK